MAGNKIDKHYEALAKLYLRLKGYLTTNLILHSDKQGDSKSELDIIAIRMPHHLQEYRWVNVQDYLNCSHSSIEIIIADVKNYSKLEKVEFNKGLRKDRESIRQLINWLGVYENVNIELIDKFEKYLNLHRNKNLDGFAEFDEELNVGRFRFKFTFFCPALPAWKGKGFKYIHGEEMLEFVWECLNESKRVETCSRRYDFSGWNEFEFYVRFFKGNQSNATLKEFEKYCTEN